MITQKEIDKINSLNSFKDNMECLIRGFDSKSLKSSLGITISNGEVVSSNNSFFFHKELRSIREQLTSILMIMLKDELEKTNVEISKYIRQ